MEKIASFTVDHQKLLRGVYVSRIDRYGDVALTTFDIRMKRPNKEKVMEPAEMHAIEHLAATYLRNDPTYKDKTVYFGPMGCRTGFYLVLSGEYQSKDVLDLMVSLFEFIRDFEGDIPGASPSECGNYSDMDLAIAKKEAASFLEILYHPTDEHFIYPQ